MTPAQRRRAFIRAIQEQIRRRGLQKDDGVLHVLGTLKELEAQLERTLEGTPSSFDAERIPEVLRELRQHLERWQLRAIGRAEEALEMAWSLGPAIVDASLAAAEIQIGTTLIPTSLLEEAKTFSATKIKGIGPRALQRIDDEIARLALGGRTPHEAMTTVAQELGEDHLPFVGFRSETVVRTEMGRLHSQAGDRRLQDAARKIPGLGKQWIWSGKSRATHRAITGQIREADVPFDVGGEQLRYPRDPNGRPENTINCGCESVPYMAEWT